MATSFINDFNFLRFFKLAVILFVTIKASFFVQAQDSAVDNSVKDVIFQTRLNEFNSANYNAAVKSLFSAFERASDNKLKRGAKGRVGFRYHGRKRHLRLHPRRQGRNCAYHFRLRLFGVAYRR